MGLSGFSYTTWKGEGRFYPADVPAAKFLNYYATRYGAVEMDGSFYKTPTENGIAEWIKRTPDDFQFSFKVHRRISHLARLKPECLEGVHYLLNRLSPMAKAGKLGSFLVQLPPNFKRNDERLQEFLEKAPTNLKQVEACADVDHPVRWSFEFRNDSWNDPEVEEILRRHGAAWVAADTDAAAAQRRGTAGHVYARLRRSEYDDARLDDWASYFQGHLDAGRDCFVYCKHEDEGSPWIWADYLLKRISV